MHAIVFLMGSRLRKVSYLPDNIVVFLYVHERLHHELFVGIQNHRQNLRTHLLDIIFRMLELRWYSENKKKSTQKLFLQNFSQRVTILTQALFLDEVHAFRESLRSFFFVLILDFFHRLFKIEYLSSLKMCLKKTDGSFQRLIILSLI